MCPERGSDQVTFDAFDFGLCPQTGYHDAGERFRCRTCGATGDAADAVRPMGPSFAAAAAGGKVAQFR